MEGFTQIIDLKDGHGVKALRRRGMKAKKKKFSQIIADENRRFTQRNDLHDWQNRQNWQNYNYFPHYIPLLPLF